MTVKEVEMARVRSTHGEKRVLMGKPEEKRPLGRLRSTWEVNNKIWLRETGWDGMY
jgi:hypothetical protein